MNHNLYQEIADGINQTVGRKAVTVGKLKQIVKEGKQIRRTQGMMALWQYAQNIPYRFLTSEEAEMLRNSPRFRELSNKTLELLVMEGVITPLEGKMFRRYI
ncbi:hypothetical protein [Thermoflavimicrobium dichotomicum]|uniref:Uncharacterized protein n=1 Tax=Thermoflavimicrobium dichotomicum TaxID=46223 RepID=A0A1I3SSN8_9BACL|nr:hypothetical protein [Thermoflavimicrobium dichotomicum]SFJ61360.1 hypothetical protein SAMN05421852_11420 [Thermoflavimicrobium dichotomicum]